MYFKNECFFSAWMTLPRTTIQDIWYTYMASQRVSSSKDSHYSKGSLTMCISPWNPMVVSHLITYHTTQELLTKKAMEWPIDGATEALIQRQYLVRMRQNTLSSTCMLNQWLLYCPASTVGRADGLVNLWELRGSYGSFQVTLLENYFFPFL